MKRIIFKSILCLTVLVMFLFTLTACENNNPENPEITKTKTIEHIKMSDGAMEYLKQGRDFLLSYSKHSLSQEGFTLTLENLYAREQQKMADAELSNTLSSRDYDGNALYMLSGDDNYDCTVLYIHGGAYVFDITGTHLVFCDMLADKLNAKVYIPLYPLAPQSTFEEAYEFMDLVYADLLKEGKPVYIMGDSAGGGFTLAFTEYLKATGKMLPEKLVLFSPWVDVTMENREIAAYEYCDISLATYGAVECGKLWAGDTDRKDYRISPLYGDLSNLPDILMFVGNHEIIYPDDMKLYESVSDTNITLIVGEGLWHVFTIYAVPEREYALNRIADFVG